MRKRRFRPVLDSLGTRATPSSIGPEIIDDFGRPITPEPGYVAGQPDPAPPAPPSGDFNPPALPVA